MISYTKLGDDLATIIQSFDSNPTVTDWQRNTWQQDGNKRAITRAMLGCDHKKALAFQDGAKVGSRRQNTARRFWDYAGGHKFPPLEDVVRFSLFMHLDMYRTLALVMKAKWEDFFASEKGYTADSGKNLTDILLGAEKAVDEAHAKFRPSCNEVYDLLAGLASHHAPASSNGGPFLEGHTPQTFEDLVSDMLKGRYHFCSNTSEELARFTARKREEHTVLVQGTEDERNAYFVEKANWIKLRNELEDIHILIESQRIRNARTRHEWLALFGKEALELREAELESDLSKTRYELKMFNPEMTREDIEKEIEEKIREEKAELSELRINAVLAAHPVSISSQGDTSAKGTEPEEYLKEYKSVLRQIHKLLHPDTLQHHPSYAKMTKGQKERLEEVLRSALEIRSEELGYPGMYLLHDIRSLEGLKRTLSFVEEILANPGSDTDERLSIQGKTLKEKLEWLQREVRALNDEMIAARADLQALFEDEARAEERSVLDNPSCHEAKRAQLISKAEKKRQKARESEEKFNALFGPKGGS